MSGATRQWPLALAFSRVCGGGMETLAIVTQHPCDRPLLHMGPDSASTRGRSDTVGRLLRPLQWGSGSYPNPWSHEKLMQTYLTVWEFHP